VCERRHSRSGSTSIRPEPSGVPVNSVVAGGRNESNSPNGLPNNPGTRTTVTTRLRTELSTG
jgi:hypothetical protein